MEIWDGGGLWPWKSGWEGGSKNLAISRGGMDFFWNNPLLHVDTIKSWL